MRRLTAERKEGIQYKEGGAVTPAQRKEGIQVCLLWHRHRCQSRRWQRRQPRHRCQSRHLRQSWHQLLQRPRRKITKKFLKKLSILQNAEICSQKREIGHQSGLQSLRFVSFFHCKHFENVRIKRLSDTLTRQRGELLEKTLHFTF